MSWWDSLDGKEWRKWLLTLTDKHHVSAGQRLDPFGTSMRSLSRQVVPWLRAVQSGNAIEGQAHRVRQAFTDMASIKLVDGQKLTSFASSFLKQTDDYPTTFEYELPFTYALLLEAVEHQIAPLLAMLEFWWDIRQLHDDDDILGDRDGLLLVSYLNQAAHPVAYNPWVALRAADAPLQVPVDWAGMKAAILDRDASTDEAVEILANRVSDNRRYAPRVVFCAAMDLVFQRHTDLQAATDHLEAMKLPVRHDR